MTLEHLRHAGPTTNRDDPWPADARTVLVTAHRRESFGAALEGLWEAIADLAARFPDVHFLCPVHPNPEITGAAPAVSWPTPATRVSRRGTST